MKVIYIDVLFTINFIINYIILLTSAKFGGFSVKRKRVFLGALLGALYSAVMFFPQISFIYTVWIKVLFIIIVSGVSYGFERPKILMRKAVIVFVVSFALGGGMIAVSNLFSGSVSVNNGVPYINMSLKTLVIASLICYVIIGLIFKSYGKRAERCIKHITVSLRQKTVELDILIDTGCELRDPISGRAVIVCEKQAVSALVGDSICKELEGFSENSAVDIMQKIINFDGGERFRIVPFKTVGNVRKMMLSFRPDEITAENGKKLDALIGISDVNFSSGCGYSALMGTKCQ